MEAGADLYERIRSTVQLDGRTRAAQARQGRAPLAAITMTHGNIRLGG